MKIDYTYQMLCEMNEKAKKLCELMKQGIVEFIFIKKSNGKRRKAHGTLKRDIIPAEAQRKRGRPKKRPDDVVIYFDTDKQEIRSFKDYLLKSFKKSSKTKIIDVNKTKETNKAKSNQKDKEDSIKDEKKSK